MKSTSRVLIRKFSISPINYLDYKDFLQALYLAIKKEVKDYTYIRYAQDLGFSATGVIHQMIKGRRVLSSKSCLKIISVLNYKNYERQYLLQMVAYCNANDPDEKADCFKKMIEIRAKHNPSQLSHDQLEFVSEWYHPVIKELIALPQINQDPNIIGKMLTPSLRPKQVKDSIELLERLSFIYFDKASNRYNIKTNEFKTPRSVQGLLAARYHQSCIELAKTAASNVEKSERDISSVTMRVSQDLIQRIKEQIYQFQMEMLEQEEEVVDTDSIHQLNIQFFPLTKTGLKKQL